MTTKEKPERYTLTVDEQGEFCVVRMDDPSVVILRGHPDNLLAWVDNANRGRETRPIAEIQEESAIEQPEAQEQPEEEIPEELVEEEDVACGNQASLSSYF